MKKHGIYEVHYNEEHSKIAEVKLHEILENDYILTLIDDDKKSVNEVISEIEMGDEYFTLIQDKSGNLKIGSKVITYEVGDEKFIKTEGNSDENDNLSELPEY